MSTKWDSVAFLEKLKETKDLHGHALLRVMSPEFDYEKDVLKMQFPAPGPRPASGARPVVFEFDGTLDPDTVNTDSVILRVEGEAEAVPADVQMLDEHRVAVRPVDGWKKPSRLDVILTPNIRTQGGRDFVGYAALIDIPAM